MLWILWAVSLSQETWGSPLVVRAVGTCVFSQSHDKNLLLLEPLQRPREQVLKTRAHKIPKVTRISRNILFLYLLLQVEVQVRSRRGPGPLHIDSELDVELQVGTEAFQPLFPVPLLGSSSWLMP